MILSFLFGFALLILGKKTEAILGGIMQLEKLITQTMEFVIKLFPAIIYFSLVNMIVTADGDVVGDNLIFAVYLLGAVLISGVVSLIFYAIDAKESPFRLLRNFKVPLITAFATCSTSSTIFDDKKIALQELGGDSKFVDFVVPVAHVLMKLAVQSVFFAVPLYLMLKYNGGADISFLITCALIATVMTFAVPSMCGGCVIVLMSIISGFSIPLDNIGMISGIVMIEDFITTAICVLSMEAIIASAVKADRMKRSRL